MDYSIRELRLMYREAIRLYNISAYFHGWIFSWRRLKRNQRRSWFNLAVANWDALQDDSRSDT